MTASPLLLPSNASADELLSSAAPPEVRALAALLNRCKPATREVYAREVMAFISWCERKGIPPLAVTRINIDTWLREMQEPPDGSRPPAPKTVAKRLAAVQQYYLEAQDLELVTRVPTARVIRPKVAGDQRLGIDREAVRRVVAEAVKSGPRNETLVCLLLFNGLRVSEACGLDVGSITEDAGVPLIRFTGKGGKLHADPLAPVTISAIDRYLDGRKSLTGTTPLLLMPDGRRMTRFDAHRITTQLGRRAGLRARLNPHELRHTAVTLALQAGIDLYGVQTSIGHADPKTTAGYNRARLRLENHMTFRLAEFILEPGAAPT